MTLENGAGATTGRRGDQPLLRRVRNLSHRPTQPLPVPEDIGNTRTNGFFADYAVLPVEILHSVPEAVNDDQAVYVGPLAAALEIADQGHVRPMDCVVVLGDGKLGLLVS